LKKFKGKSPEILLNQGDINSIKGEKQQDIAHFEESTPIGKSLAAHSLYNKEQLTRNHIRSGQHT